MQYSLWPLLEFMKHGSPIWNWIPLYSDERQDQFQTRTFKYLFLQITVQIGGKLLRLREDSFSILIKQDAWEIIQYCGTRVRILSGSNCFFVLLWCHTAHYYRSKSHKIFISNYADQTNKKVSLRMHEYNICCKSCSKSVYFSRTKEVLLTMLWQNLNTLFWSLYLISML